MLRTLSYSLIFAAMLCAEVLHAEVFPMTLRQAVEMALKQNPDLTLARLDEEKARQAVRVAHDPFVPRLVVGSGLAYSDGFPMSIEGAAPSIVQANATQYLFNRPQSYIVAQARENIRGAQLGALAKREEIAYSVASLYVDAERAGRLGALAAKDAQSFEQVLATVQEQVKEGRALPLAEKQAELNLARARQTAENLQSDQVTAETELAMALGLSAQDGVHPTEENLSMPEAPRAEDEVIQQSLASNNEIRQLESQVAAKELEIRGDRSARLPRVDLVAQYAMLARFNNYDEFFRHFQRNNGQIGVSVQLPLFAGPGVRAQAAEAMVDVERLQAQITSTRNRIISDIQQAFRDQKKAATAADVARLDLDVAREQVSVILAQMEEGRATLRQAEEARVTENGKWIAFYESQYTAAKSRWNLLRLSGGLVAALEGTASK